MPESIEVTYGKPGTDQRKELVTIYKTEDKDSLGFPTFYHMLVTIKNVIYSVKAGEWLETHDGYIVPILTATSAYFRIPGGGSYRRWHIAQGAKLLVRPPSGYKMKLQNEGGGTFLTNMQLAFCWQMAKDWNVEKAMKVAGYKWRNRDYLGAMSRKLMQSPKIRQGIMNAVKVHLQSLELNGEDFVLRKQEELMKTLQEVQTYLKTDLLNKVQNNNMTSTDVQNFLDVTEKLGGEIKESAKWLGYGKEGGDNGNGGDEGFDFTFAQLKRKSVKQIGDNHDKAEGLQEGEYVELDSRNGFNQMLVETKHSHEVKDRQDESITE